MRGAGLRLFRHSSLVGRFRPVYVTSGCKAGSLELHLPTVVNSDHTQVLRAWPDECYGDVTTAITD
jgi:hypothetical protein